MKIPSCEVFEFYPDRTPEQELQRFREWLTIFDLSLEDGGWVPTTKYAVLSWGPETNYLPGIKFQDDLPKEENE